MKAFPRGRHPSSAKFLRPEKPNPLRRISSITTSPVYVYITIRHGAHDEDPGEIAEGMYSVGGRAVVLTDLDGRQITSRALSDGQDPAKLARRLGIA